MSCVASSFVPLPKSFQTYKEKFIGRRRFINREQEVYAKSLGWKIKK